MSKFANRKLPPVDQMPAKKLAALREMQMIARYGAARVMSTNLKPVEEKHGKKTYS